MLQAYANSHQCVAAKTVGGIHIGDCNELAEAYYRNVFVWKTRARCVTGWRVSLAIARTHWLFVQIAHAGKGNLSKTE